MLVSRQQQLIDIVLKLSENNKDISQSEDEVVKYAELFCGIYDNPAFRHRYSDISRCLYGDTTPQTEQDFKDISRRADRLVMNLGSLKEPVAAASARYPVDVAEAIRLKFNKLYDHVSLEYFRLLLFESPYHSFESLAGDIDDMKELAHELGDSVDGTNEKLASSQKDYIAILAIFAAVIMAFSGGFGFISGSFGELASADLAKLSCLVALVGTVLVDLLYVLLRFVWGVIRKENDSARIPHTSAIIVVANVVLMMVFLFSFAVSMGWLPAGDGSSYRTVIAAD